MRNSSKNYIKITPLKAKKLLESNSNILLIDVRTPEEYAGGHLPGSINIPVQVLGWQIDSLPVSPSTPVIVYCKSGGRAASAASMLLQKGFQTVYTFGGIENWPYEIVRY